MIVLIRWTQFRVYTQRYTVKDVNAYQSLDDLIRIDLWLMRPPDNRALNQTENSRGVRET